jgi:hypothetical protein
MKEKRSKIVEVIKISLGLFLMISYGYLAIKDFHIKDCFYFFLGAYLVFQRNILQFKSHKRFKLIITATLVLIFSGIILYLFVKNNSSNNKENLGNEVQNAQSKEDNEIDIFSLAKELNKRCPSSIGNEDSLMKITVSNGNILIYVYKLGYKLKDIDTNSFLKKTKKLLIEKLQIETTYAKQAATQNLLFKHVYFDKDNKLIGSSELSKSEYFKSK